jgi:hypothetical protein
LQKSDNKINGSYDFVNKFKNTYSIVITSYIVISVATVGERICKLNKKVQYVCGWMVIQLDL